VDENNLLGDLLAKYNVGDEVTLKIWHRGDAQNIKITLGERK
jgi:S1-C subfamily serine protease